MSERADLLQGTLDLLILKALVLGPLHGWGISKRLRQLSSEVLEVGQEIKVKVLDLDLDRKRISLSIRELEDDPWDEISAKFQEGQLVEGTVTKLTKFGAFARLAETDDYEVEGLIHISELSERRVEHPREVVNEGDVLTLRIINVDPERRRIGLSLRKVDSADFADQDWKTAMEEIDGEEGAEAEVDEPVEDMVDEVEDFDAALEAEDRAPETVPMAEGAALDAEDESPESVLETDGAALEDGSPENVLEVEGVEPELEDPGGGQEN